MTALGIFDEILTEKIKRTMVNRQKMMEVSTHQTILWFDDLITLNIEYFFRYSHYFDLELLDTLLIYVYFDRKLY